MHKKDYLIKYKTKIKESILSLLRVACGSKKKNISYLSFHITIGNALSSQYIICKQ